MGTDDEGDIALLKIEASGLNYATLGDSDSLKVGDAAVAIGNPLGELAGSVSQGIISALDREITLNGETMNLLQTDAAINPGNSGGALFNANGEVIGIVVAKSGGDNVEGLGFAIPVNDVKEIVDQLSTYGYVTGRPTMGASFVDISDQMTAVMYRVDRLGVYVLSTEENSAGGPGRTSPGRLRPVGQWAGGLRCQRYPEDCFRQPGGGHPHSGRDPLQQRPEGAGPGYPG